MTELNDKQLEAYAYVIEQECDHTGKRWDRPGIIAQVRKLPVSPGAALDAALAAARDPNAATPAAIAWSQYWPRESAPATTTELTCDECHKPQRACRIADSKAPSPSATSSDPRGRAFQSLAKSCPDTAWRFSAHDGSFCNVGGKLIMDRSR